MLLAFTGLEKAVLWVSVPIVPGESYLLLLDNGTLQILAYKLLTEQHVTHLVFSLCND